MPVVLSLSMLGGEQLARVLVAVGAGVAGGFSKIARALKNRREAATLAGMDDRMLADIGLTRSDLRDAYSEPLWHDPTDVLAQRAAERRGNRGQVAAGCVAKRTLPPALLSKPLFPSKPADRAYPAADRPGRFLV
jgi:uncharacterized protein YjiS (DUF1127 family)